MFGICRHALETVSYHFPKGADIFILCRKDSDQSRFFKHRIPVICLKEGRIMESGCLDFGFEALPDGDHLRDLLLDGIGIEICVRDRHEEASQHFVVHFGNACCVNFALYDNIGDAFNCVNKKILEFCDVLFLAAYALYGTSLVHRGFLTLKTEHAHISFPLLFLTYIRPYAFATFIPNLTASSLTLSEGFH